MRFIPHRRFERPQDEQSARYFHSARRRSLYHVTNESSVLDKHDLYLSLRLRRMMSQQPRRCHFIVVAVDVLQILVRSGLLGIGSVGGGRREGKKCLFFPSFSKAWRKFAGVHTWLAPFSHSPCQISTLACCTAAPTTKQAETLWFSALLI